MPTRKEQAAARRAALYKGRLAAAGRSERDRMNALVGWLMTEFYRMPIDEKPTWFQKIRDLAEEMNERSRR